MQGFDNALGGGFVTKGPVAIDSIMVRRSDFEWAVAQGYINNQQLEPLWRALDSRTDARERVNFGVAPLLAWGGIGMVLIAMAVLLLYTAATNHRVLFCFLSIMYIAFFMALGCMTWSRRITQLPRAVGGTCVTVAVSMIPLAVYGAYLPYWVGHILMLIAGATLVYFIQFPLLAVPIYWGLFELICHDMPVYMWRLDEYNMRSWYVQASLTFFFGLGSLCLAQVGHMYIRHALENQKLNEKRAILFDGFVFWIFVCGAFTFFTGITFFMIVWGWWADTLAALLYMGLFIGGMYLSRIALTCCGAIGLFILFTDLIATLFGWNAWFGAIVFTMIGIGLVAAGMGVHYYWLKKAPLEERLQYENIEGQEADGVSSSASKGYGSSHRRNDRDGDSYQFGEEMAELGSFVGTGSNNQSSIRESEESLRRLHNNL